MKIKKQTNQPPPNKSGKTNQNQMILNNVSNYNPIIISSFSDISMGFLNVIFEYVYKISETSNITNKKYYHFIFKRGLETLIHVFTLLFYYTKNVELTVHYSKNALYEYIEFIDQMSDDKVTFLKLTTRDAVLFVYKKTIFDINNEYRKNLKEPSIEDKYMLSVLNTYTNICKNVILFIINYSIFDKPTINECYNCVKNIGDNVYKIKPELVEYINVFAVVLNDIKMKNQNLLPVTEYLDLLHEFTRMISKKKINENFKNNIYDFEIINGKMGDIIEFIFTDN